MDGGADQSIQMKITKDGTTSSFAATYYNYVQYPRDKLINSINSFWIQTFVKSVCDTGEFLYLKKKKSPYPHIHGMHFQGSDAISWAN